MKKILSIFLSLIMVCSVSIATTSAIKNAEKVNVDEKTNTTIISEEDLKKEYNSGFDDGKKSQETTITELNDTITDLNSQITDKDSQLTEKDSQLSEKDSLIAEKDSLLAEKDAEIDEMSSVKSDYEALLSGEKCLVTFKVNDYIYDTQIVTSGSYLTMPEEPTLDGDLKFCGWKDAQGNKVYNIADNPVTASSTYTAISTDTGYFSIYFRIDGNVVYTQYVATGDRIDFSLVDAPGYDIYDINGNNVDVAQPSDQLDGSQYYDLLPSSDSMLDVALLNSTLLVYEADTVIFDTLDADNDHMVEGAVSLSIDGNVKMYFDKYFPGTVYILSDSTIYPATCENMFSDLSRLKSITFNNISFKYVSSAKKMFYNCSKLTNISVANNTLQFNDKISDLSYMFSGCSRLQDAPRIYAPNASNCDSMFLDCTSLDYYDFNFIDYVSNLECNYLFARCSSLRYVTFAPNANTISSSNAFVDCTNLTSVDIRDLLGNYPTFTNTSSMFENCSALTRINSYYTGTMTITGNSSNMFWGCSALETSSGFTYSDECVTGTYASTTYYIYHLSE